MKFMIIESDGTLLPETYPDALQATAAAEGIVTDEPDTEVTVVQAVKKVSSKLEVFTQDVV